MSCEVCERPMIWAGQSYAAHTEAQHAGTRRWLLNVAGLKLGQLLEVRQAQTEAQVQDCVVVQWRSGVYRRQIPDEWWMVPCEWWDGLGPKGEAHILRSMRVFLSDRLRQTHGAEVNPATWFHRLHDWRDTHGEACVCGPCVKVRELRNA